MKSMFQALYGSAPQDSSKCVSQQSGIDGPIRLHARNQRSERMSVASDAGDSVLLCFDQCRARSTERVKQQVVFTEFECRNVLPDQVRREGQHKSIPTVDREVILL